MDYIRFGQTGLKVSQLCLGTMSMGSSAWKGWVLDEGDSIPILRRALDLGHHLLRHGRLVFHRPQRGGRRPEPA